MGVINYAMLTPCCILSAGFLLFARGMFVEHDLQICRITWHGRRLTPKWMDFEISWMIALFLLNTPQPSFWKGDFFFLILKEATANLAFNVDNCVKVSRTTQERASVLREAADALKKIDPRLHVLTYQSIQIVSLSAFSFDSLVRKFYSLPSSRVTLS